MMSFKRADQSRVSNPILANVSALNLLPVLALVVFGWLFLRHISALDGAEVKDALFSISIWQWISALFFTALSFQALGQYDVIIHRLLRTGQSRKTSRAAGIKAIALSQSLGFGVLSSALVRWRCLPDLSALACLRLSALVSVSFMAALTVVAAVVLPFSGLFEHRVALVLGAIGAGFGLIALSRIAQAKGWMPTALCRKTLIALVLATAADTIFAAAALWMLWPEAVSFPLLFAAYLIALGAGLLSNAPGGVGAFDLAILALIPATQDTQALAALLAFRIAYYGIPAFLALLGLMRPTAETQSRVLPDHPEAALALQSAQVFNHPKGAILTLPSFGNDTILSDLPAGMDLSDLFGRAPKVLYKCSAKQAAQARAQGWAVMRCASEGLIDLADWTLEGSRKRQLRRALKGFDGNGLRIAETHDMFALAPVAQAWRNHRGRERGLSMGRYCPDYLSHQRVFAAFDGDTPVAFASFHTGPIWTLDLMRHGADIPSGTLQALICAGIEAARQDGAQTLSLAAVPSFAASLPYQSQIMAKAAGLIRFKSAFAPVWQPRYICAPSTTRLIAAAATLSYAIHRPEPLFPLHSRDVHCDNENYSFAYPRLTCEREETFAGATPHDQSSLRPSFNT